MTNHPFAGGMMTIESILAADRLLETYDNDVDEFTSLFLEADRQTLGAVVAYTDMAFRTAAEELGLTLTEVRLQMRLAVCQAQGVVDERGDFDD